MIHRQPSEVFRSASELKDLYLSWLETRDLMWTEIIVVESWAFVMFPSLRHKPDWTPDTMPLKVKQLSRLLPRINTIVEYLEYEASLTKLAHGLDLKEIFLHRHQIYLQQPRHPYTLIHEHLDRSTLHVFLPLYPGQPSTEDGKFINYYLDF